MAASMSAPLVRRRHHRFYNGMSLLIAAIVFAGFYRTFYLSPWLHGPGPVAAADCARCRLLRLDLLFVTQTTLVAVGRTDLHRRLGIAGAVLAGGMVVLGSVRPYGSARRAGLRRASRRCLF